MPSAKARAGCRARLVTSAAVSEKTRYGQRGMIAAHEVGDAEASASPRAAPPTPARGRVPSRSCAQEYVRFVARPRRLLGLRHGESLVLEVSASSAVSRSGWSTTPRPGRRSPPRRASPRPRWRGISRQPIAMRRRPPRRCPRRRSRAAGVRRRHAGHDAERHEQAVLGAEHGLAHAREPRDARRLAERVVAGGRLDGGAGGVGDGRVERHVASAYAEPSRTTRTQRVPVRRPASPAACSRRSPDRPRRGCRSSRRPEIPSAGRGSAPRGSTRSSR